MQITGSGGVSEQEMTALSWLPNFKAAETFQINAPSAEQEEDCCSSEAVSTSRWKEGTLRKSFTLPHFLGPPSVRVHSSD